METIRLFLVDDEQTVRKGLRMRLEMEPDFEIVGEAADGQRAVAGVREANPDVVLMDVELPLVDGIQATAALRVAAPGCAVVMLSMHDDSGTRTRAREAGAVAFVAKHEIDGALSQAIRAAVSRPSGAIEELREERSRAEEKGAQS
jgi:DNA-binding NarL/FixJ family response regulator